MILAVVGLVFVAAVVRVIWSVWRGGMQIEPSSHGRQLVGRSEKKRKTE